MKGDIEKFRVIKAFSTVKVGKKFDCFGGLVSGVSNSPGESILFTNKEYFKPVVKRK